MVGALAVLQSENGAESLSSAFSALRLEAGQVQESGQLSLLAQIDQMLRKEHEEKGVSITQMKKYIQARGICLRNGEEYGSASALRAELRKDRSKLVPRKQAKQYKYVKMCLMRL